MKTLFSKTLFIALFALPCAQAGMMSCPTPLISDVTDQVSGGFVFKVHVPNTPTVENFGTSDPNNKQQWNTGQSFDQVSDIAVAYPPVGDATSLTGGKLLFCGPYQSTSFRELKNVNASRDTLIVKGSKDVTTNADPTLHIEARASLNRSSAIQSCVINGNNVGPDVGFTCSGSGAPTTIRCPAFMNARLSTTDANWIAAGGQSVFTSVVAFNPAFPSLLSGTSNIPVTGLGFSKGRGVLQDDPSQPIVLSCFYKASQADPYGLSRKVSSAQSCEAKNEFTYDSVNKRWNYVVGHSCTVPPPQAPGSTPSK